MTPIQSNEVDQRSRALCLARVRTAEQGLNPTDAGVAWSEFEQVLRSLPPDDRSAAEDRYIKLWREEGFAERVSAANLARNRVLPVSDSSSKTD